jgi:hypothetical protein
MARGWGVVREEETAVGAAGVAVRCGGGASGVVAAAGGVGCDRGSDPADRRAFCS